MTDLITRLERATGPDRELDYSILLVTDRDYYEWCDAKGRELADKAKNNGLQGRDEACRYDGFSGCHRYTGSIDAAVTLVPERHRWLLDKRPDANQREDGYRAQVYRQGHHYQSDMSDMPTAWAINPAIALSIAALKARTAMQEGERTK